VTTDLVITNGKIVTPDSVFDGSIAIKDGKVLAVGEAGAMPPATETFDAGGLHILPGAIDDHVHFRDPGLTHKEDWESGTAAAAFGGVTCVFEMPNTLPPVATGEILAAKHKIASSKAHVDYGLYGLLGDETIKTVPELIENGIIGFKLYMGNTFGKIPSPDTGAPANAADGGGQEGPMGASGGAAQCRCHRSGRPGGDSGRMDRRTPSCAAHLDRGRAAAVARSQGARRRYHRRDLSALSRTVDRGL
jgi:dihydroorotase